MLGDWVLEITGFNFIIKVNYFLQYSIHTLFQNNYVPVIMLGLGELKKWVKHAYALTDCTDWEEQKSVVRCTQ